MGLTLPDHPVMTETGAERCLRGAMDPFARIAETHDEMSEQMRHLRLVDAPRSDSIAPETPVRTDRGRVALLHEWRAAQIARSKAMHPSNVARALAVPALRPLR
jgi:hypothetical protein